MSSRSALQLELLTATELRCRNNNRHCFLCCRLQLIEEDQSFYLDYSFRKRIEGRGDRFLQFIILEIYNDFFVTRYPDVSVNNQHRASAAVVFYASGFNYRTRPTYSRNCLDDLREKCADYRIDNIRPEPRNRLAQNKT